MDGIHGTGTWPRAAEAVQTRTLCVPGVPSLEVGILSLSAPAVPDVPGILDGQSGRSGHGRSAQGEAAKFHLSGTAGSGTKVNPSMACLKRLEKGAKCLPSTVAFLHLGPASFRTAHPDKRASS